jgi:small-conductance mechanosensitive channel
MNPDLSIDALRPWLVDGGILVAAVFLALLAHRIVFGIAERVTKRTGSTLDDSLVRHARKPTRLLLPLLVASATIPALPLPPAVTGGLLHAAGLGVIASVAWLIVSLTGVLEDLVASRYDIDKRDNLDARRVQTRFRVLQRIVGVVAVIVALAIMLMTFPTIRHLGTSLLASAGAAGLIVGLAARPTLSSLIAGIQLALTEPIRIEDVVIVEGEWGWIEEIAATYVVVRIWDLRRLVVPLSYFLEHPFQNWTRQTADLLGTAYVYCDYTVPVEEVREQLHRILKGSDLWDGKAWGLQVTNATEHTLELRALMSTADSGAAWNLRCHVREKLVAYLQERHPQSLPRVRAELGGAGMPAMARG